jgi:hypothetical protein
VTNFEWFYIVIGPLAALALGGILFWSSRFIP